MTDWLVFAPIAAAAVVVVFVPGLLIGMALRIRGMLLWGLAPAAGTAALAVAAVALGLLGIPWTAWSAVAVVVVLCILALPIGHLSKPARSTAPSGYHPSPLKRMGVLAVVAGAFAGAARMATIIGAPSNLSQTNDATFHLNALRFIQESGSASSLDLSGMLGSSSFYPAAWHAVASLVADISGAGVVEAANATSLAIAGPIWTLSITSFVWYTTGGRRVATAAAALMAPTLFAFPFYMLDFGVLYPYALSLAVLPGVLAVLVSLVREQGSIALRSRTIWIAVVAASMGLAAIALAQPAVLLNWLIGAVVLACWALIRGWRELPSRRRRRRSAAIVGVLTAALVAWLALTSISSSALWEPQKNAGRAAIDLLLNSGAGSGPMLSMSVLAAVGLVIALRRIEFRWLAVYAGAISMLVIAAVSVQNETVRNLLAAWYADPHRFVAMMPMVVIPLAAIGWEGVFDHFRARPRTAIVLTAAALVVILLETLAWTFQRAVSNDGSYARNSTSYLSSDEYDMLEQLPEYVAPGARVLGNPSTGAAFGYALSGVDVIPRTWSMPGDADFQLLRDDLVGLAEDPAVCAAVERMEIDYVLDFGESAEGAGKWDMPGMTGFEDHAGFRLVAERGGASLWQIEECSTG